MKLSGHLAASTLKAHGTATGEAWAGLPSAPEPWPWLGEVPGEEAGTGTWGRAGRSPEAGS